MISKDAVITIVVRFITLIAGFATSVITARYLGPSGRGDYFFLITLLSLLTQFAHLGLASSNTYLVAKNPMLLGELVINSFWVSLIIGIVVASISLIVLSTSYTSQVTGSWVLLPLVPITIFYLLGTNLLIGINKIASFNLFQIISNVLVFLLLVASGLLGKQVTGFLVASLIGWGFMSFSLLYSLVGYAKNKNYTLWFNKKIFMHGASFGVKAYLATLMGLFVLKGNVLLLKHFCNETILGYYSVASQLNDCIIILPASIGLVLFPSLVRNIDNCWNEMKRCLFFTTGLMLLVCILAAVLVRPFIQIAFGSSFLPAVPIFLWTLPGGFFLGLITIISQYLAAKGFPKLQVLVWCMAFLMVLLSSWILIPIYGGSGAAISLSLTYFSLFCIILVLAKTQQGKLN